MTIHQSRRSVLAAGAALPLLAIRSATAEPAPAGAGSAEQRLRERGIVLPDPPAPSPNYAPFVRTGNLVFVSGLGPTRPDGSVATGKVGRDVTLDDAYQHARLTGLSILAVLRGVGGDLDRVVRVVKVLGMVNATPDFTDHGKVINGCTDLFSAVFGEAGRASRSSVGMISLPSNISVEIETAFEVS